MSAGKRIPRRALFITLAAAAVGAVLALRSRAPHPVEIGGAAPGFNLPALGGKAVRLADYRGQVVLINFWATWCPPCVEETPSLVKFADELRNRGVVVIGVSVDDDPAALDKFVAAHHLTYPIVRDPSGELAHRYGTFKFPETYILDRGGDVAEKIIGAYDWNDPRIIKFVENLADPSARSTL